jgi:hypothetical protein
LSTTAVCAFTRRLVAASNSSRFRPQNRPLFIGLHPAKGIALVDLFPARPQIAIAPLDEFLARTGFAAFSRGDLPIVAR